LLQIIKEHIHTVLIHTIHYGKLCITELGLNGTLKDFQIRFVDFFLSSAFLLFQADSLNYDPSDIIGIAVA